MWTLYITNQNITSIGFNELADQPEMTSCVPIEDL